MKIDENLRKYEIDKSEEDPRKCGKTDYRRFSF